MRIYFIYIMASRSRVLYTGVTNDLKRRVSEHKQSLVAGFTSKYRVTRLVHFEEFADIRDAIAREKEIKGWKRLRKIRLIENRNPRWDDLAENWFPLPSNSFFCQTRATLVILSERADARERRTCFTEVVTRV